MAPRINPSGEALRKRLQRVDERLGLLEQTGVPAGQVQTAVDMWLDQHPPAAGKDGLPGTRGSDGAPGLNATLQQIESAVAEWLTANPPAPGADGEDGQNGQDAPAPTQQAIQSAVDAYIAAHPPAQGRDGIDGTPGAAGQNATDAQVSAAVSAYLSAHPPAQGAKGNTGDRGPSGRSIASTEMSGGHLVLHYDDGASVDVGQVKGADGDNATNAQVASAVSAYIGTHPPAAGASGVDGARGSLWTSGNGAPVSTGNRAGDQYLDASTGDVWQWS